MHDVNPAAQQALGAVACAAVLGRLKAAKETDRPVGESGLLSAAATYHIYQDLGLGDSQPQNMPGTEWKSKNLNSFLWGLIRQDLPITNCRLANGQRVGIEQIKIGRNVLQVLATIATLGIWAPTRVSWRCCRPPSQSGTLQ